MVTGVKGDENDEAQGRAQETGKRRKKEKKKDREGEREYQQDQHRLAVIREIKRYKGKKHKERAEEKDKGWDC